MLNVLKVFSARVLTGPMAEERSHHIGWFLQSARRPERPLVRRALVRVTSLSILNFKWVTGLAMPGDVSRFGCAAPGRGNKSAGSRGGANR